MPDKKLITLWFFVFLVMCLGFVNQSIATAIPASANEWTWPLDGDFMVLRNAKYNTTIENTDYVVFLMNIHLGQMIRTCILRYALFMMEELFFPTRRIAIQVTLLELAIPTHYSPMPLAILTQ